MMDNQYESYDEAPQEGDASESSNRTFLIAAGILGGIVLLSIACLAGYALFFRQPAQPGTQIDQVAAATMTKSAEDAFIALALTQTAEASIQPTGTPTATETPTSPVNLATLTSTPAPAGTPGALPTQGPATQAAATSTVAAALTQAAAAQLTVVPTSTLLPNTGFADDYGVPGLVVMGLAFIIVIMLARKLRSSPVIAR